jgi:serine/threonine protein kinase
MAERPVSESTDRPPSKATDEQRPAGGDLLALPAGYAINEYRIDRVLGCGGFGITYLAHDTHLDCPVAIKEYLPREMAGRDPGLAVRPHSGASAKSFGWGLERFLLECRALASFHHPGIVRVLRYFRANDTAYMVMEYESGEPLDQWLAGHPALDSAMLLRIVRPLLDGLETIHNTGFLHRDIKPRNIYIRADGSPVLLDFGSARRLGLAGQEHLLTAVVTPGFAPAEQYQPDGKQGPWTDLYALAGVMYWLVTGQLPTESLARLREDPMPAASAIGKPEVFGKAMLRAIDWALTPDENQRPLRVADFRRACLPAAGGDAPPLAGAPRGPAATQPPAGISLAEGCSFIGAVLFADVAVADPPDEAGHQEQRSRLATIVSQAVATVPASSRLAANTREGCAVCYVGDPEDALRTATLLGASASERGLGLQIGINLGPVLVQPAPSGRSRLLGDGVATAFRVMRLSEPGQVLVTRAYVELIAQLGRSASACFSLLGQRRDPQDREHDLYHYTGDSQMAASSHPVSGGHLSPTGSDISPEVADAAERLLTRHIGPLARILVRKTLPRAASREELHRLLAAMIPDPAARAAFLAGVTLPAQPHSTGAGPNSARPRLRLCTRRLSAPVTAAASGLPTGVLLSDADLDRIGKLFARYIGPMAKVLLRREASQGGDLDVLCRALARHIDSAEQRQHFLREAGVG